MGRPVRLAAAAPGPVSSCGTQWMERVTGAQKKRQICDKFRTTFGSLKSTF